MGSMLALILCITPPYWKILALRNHQILASPEADVENGMHLVSDEQRRRGEVLTSLSRVACQAHEKELLGRCWRGNLCGMDNVR
jgi:hypothetical protein